MRFLLLAVAALALAAPSHAQITLVPMVGYDIDYKALSVGGGVELALSPGLLPFQAAVRPSAEYVFVGNGLNLVRINGDVLGRFGLVGVPFRPYGKAGVAVEIGSGSSNTDVGLNLGAGAEFDRALAEVTIGIGSVSSARLAVGYPF